MIVKTMEIGSLEVGVYENGLVRLKIRAMKGGEPTSILSGENIREILAFVESEDEEELEDVL